MPTSEVFNCDCLTYMRSLPDNAFDLMVADPPFGSGFTEGGGCKGWFTKYHQNADCSQSVHVERERERENKSRSITASETSAPASSGTKRHYMFGGRKKESTYQERLKAAKEASKKSLRGTLPQGQSILKKCSASHAIKSFGAAIISSSRRRAVSWSGAS